VIVATGGGCRACHGGLRSTDERSKVRTWLRQMTAVPEVPFYRGEVASSCVGEVVRR
jgi:hypothetical protein